MERTQSYTSHATKPEQNAPKINYLNSKENANNAP